MRDVNVYVVTEVSQRGQRIVELYPGIMSEDRKVDTLGPGGLPSAIRRIQTDTHGAPLHFRRSTFVLV